jgi:nitrate reductase (cytochrome), electron transfer subunit
VGVIAMAFVGFVVGMRHGAPVLAAPVPDLPQATSQEGASIPATAYRDYDRRRHGTNAGWRSSLADLPQPELIYTEEAVEWTEEARAILRSARAQRRAFDGAPPTVPHPIDQLTSTSCIACHASGKSLGETFAPAMSHAMMHNCTQCHVEQNASNLDSAPSARNVFESIQRPLKGTRAWEGAPPTIPHPTLMRQNCISCHGTSGPQAIRTSHPWRANCMQCHAPSADQDQGIFDSFESFLPPPKVDGP